jgi:hypothetical protein
MRQCDLGDRKASNHGACIQAQGRLPMGGVFGVAPTIAMRGDVGARVFVKAHRGLRAHLHLLIATHTFTHTRARAWAGS